MKLTERQKVVWSGLLALCLVQVQILRKQPHILNISGNNYTERVKVWFLFPLMRTGIVPTLIIWILHHNEKPPLENTLIWCWSKSCTFQPYKILSYLSLGTEIWIISPAQSHRQSPAPSCCNSHPQSWHLWCLCILAKFHSLQILSHRSTRPSEFLWFHLCLLDASQLKICMWITNFIICFLETLFLFIIFICVF